MKKKSRLLLSLLLFVFACLVVPPASSGSWTCYDCNQDIGCWSCIYWPPPLSFAGCYESGPVKCLCCSNGADCDDDETCYI